MTEFKSGLLDGLICTTIVEMGLDIPNANTMIIMTTMIELIMANRNNS